MFAIWLAAFVDRHGGVSGTVHVLADEALRLRAAHNIPPKVQDVTAVIPPGKGMAGLAWERGIPVRTCNLKTDTTGDVRPGAKAVDAKAAVALPVFADDEVVAVIGIAFQDELELGAPVVDAIASDASSILRLASDVD
ncbi:MAG: GAF domain-containing protein [Planctomycetes bacterium]|nr:GAF domain-containing protein [Planctomycetota bacterium]